MVWGKRGEPAGCEKACVGHKSIRGRTKTGYFFCTAKPCGHHITSHRIASHRIASHRIASHHIASHHIASRTQTHRHQTHMQIYIRSTLYSRLWLQSGSSELSLLFSARFELSQVSHAHARAHTHTFGLQGRAIQLMVCSSDRTLGLLNLAVGADSNGFLGTHIWLWASYLFWMGKQRMCLVFVFAQVTANQVGQNVMIPANLTQCTPSSGRFPAQQKWHF